MANSGSTITMTAEKNWLFAFNSGGITANSTGLTAAWLNNQNLKLTGAVNTDTGGTGQYCIVHYYTGTMTTCPITTAGTITTASGLNDTSLTTNVKRVYYGGTAVTASNFSVSGWGSGSTFAVNTGANPIDATGVMSVTAGTSPSPFPTVTLTFADGTSPNDVTCIAVRNDLTSQLETWRQSGIGTSTSTWTFYGTPVAASTYTLEWHCDWHN
jgi:hypothetical protein